MSKRRRIVWLYPKIEKPMGGTNFVSYTAAELARDFDVLLVAQKATSAMIADSRAAGLELIELKRRSYTDPGFWFLYPLEIARTARQLAKILRPDDVVITSMYPMDVAANRLGRNDIQIMYEPFVFFHDELYLAQRGWAVRLFFQAVAALFAAEERRAVLAAERLLTLSEFESARIRDVYGRGAEVIYEGVDRNIFHPDVEPLDEYKGRTVVLHSTGFDRFKGTDTVIAAAPALAREIPNLKLVVTWTREDPRPLARYRRFVADRGLEDHVEFLGLAPFDRLPRLYRSARVYVEPGKDRAMSLSVKEAMACGTPSVRGEEGYEEVRDGVEGFLVDGDDVRTFADRVLELCRNDGLRAQMSKAGLERIATQFTWRAVADRLIETIRTREGMAAE